MKSSKEIAILFKKKLHLNEEIEFIPIKVIEGIYNEKDNSFIDKDGTPYYHIIENPDSYGFCYKDSITNYKNNYHHLSLPLIKMLLLRTIKKYTYTYNTDDETFAPLILFTSKDKTKETNILFDENINYFYEEKFPEFQSKYLKQTSDVDNEEEQSEKKELNIKEIYMDMTSNIIDQDEAIKKLISIIWKQNLGVKTLNKNIIIDGPSGVGKSKICKLLTESLDIPSVTISSSEGKMKTANHIILELVKKANGDIAKAQNGIIIIDKFEDFIMYSSFDGKGELEQITEKKQLIISSNVGEFLFDTKNLIVIGISNLEKIKPVKKQITGFYEKTYNNKIEILESFSTIIKLNTLDFDSYIKILNSPQGLLNQSIELLNSQGVKLTVSEVVKNSIAQIASNSEYKVKSLENIIERTLSIAEFEIASNPNMYSELIITPETLDNNKIYKLVRKKD